MTLNLEQINWLAVVASGVAMFLVGGITYGAIFGKKWLELHGYGQQDVERMKPTQGRVFAILFGADLLRAVVLAAALPIMGASDLKAGVLAAVLLWAFDATYSLANNAAHRKTPGAFMLDAGYRLACTIVGAIILVLWR